MTVLEIVEKMLMLGIHPDWINAVYNKGKEDAEITQSHGFIEGEE